MKQSSSMGRISMPGARSRVEVCIRGLKKAAASAEPHQWDCLP